MLEYILDTDILSEVLKGRNSVVENRKNIYTNHFQRLTFTSASVLEILQGLRKRDARAQFERAELLFAENAEVVPEAADYRLAADISGDLQKTGHTIGIVDPLIAACAIRRGFGIATGNTSHFEFIRRAGYSFHLENWRER